MSFFKNLFAKKIGFLDYLGVDKNYPELIHVFGARRIMPDDGESFDIWHHRVIDTSDFSVTHGLHQRGNEFSIKSGFAQRALEDMSKRLNRNLAFGEEKKEPALKFQFRKSGDTDTAELPEPLQNGIIVTTNNTFERERFTLQLLRDGKTIAAHGLKGIADYFNYAILLKEKNQLLVTYRKEMNAAIGGMGFYVLDLNNGALVHDGYIA